MVKNNKHEVQGHLFSLSTVLLLKCHLAPGLSPLTLEKLPVSGQVLGRQGAAMYPAAGNSQPPWQGTDIKFWKGEIHYNQHAHHRLPCLKQIATESLTGLHYMLNFHTYSFWLTNLPFFPDFNLTLLHCVLQYNLGKFAIHTLPLRWRPESDIDFRSLGQADSTRKRVVRSRCSTEG